MPDYSDLLEEIKENFDVASREWADIREEGRVDSNMIADGPWSEVERKSRTTADRLCLSFDELGQYTNQAIGDMRQNKRAIKVTPKGDGANDQTAQMRSGMIREVEYKSNAQAAYATGYENMLQRSYGYFKLSTRECSPDSFDQELVISAIPNPDTILIDPFYKEPDACDMGYAFELDHFSEKEFEKRWEHAEAVSFEAFGAADMMAWRSPDRIQVAAYWRVEKKTRKLLLLDGGAAGQMKVFLDELPKGSKIDGNHVLVMSENGDRVAVPLLRMSKKEQPAVVQYMTNGLEILEKNITKWLEIPIVVMFGPEEWIDDGGGAKRRLRSMVRKARDAYMAYCFVATNEVEVIGLVPKTLLVGYEGQFNTKTPWDQVNKVALPYGEVKARTAATGTEILPLPTRQLYDPPVQSLEMAKASLRQAIQSAMGAGGNLNGQHSQNSDARSGKAIEALDRQESQATYVFISQLERALERAGKLADHALDWVYDTDREVGTRGADDVYKPARINEKDAEGNPVPGSFQTGQGDHGVTISVGPSEMSTRDAINDFVEGLFANPNTPPQVLALGVRLRNLGPIGDQIAEAYYPSGGAPPIPQAVQKHMADSNEVIQKLTQRVQQLDMVIQAKIPELQSKERMHAQDLDFKREQLAVEASIGAAKIGSAEAIERLDIETDLIARERENAGEAAGDQADREHEAGLQGAAQAHEAALQESAQGHAKELQGSAQAAAEGAQASDQEHQAGMQDSAQEAAADAPAK